MSTSTAIMKNASKLFILFVLASALSVSVGMFGGASVASANGPSCPLVSPSLYNNLYAVTPGSSVTLDLTDLGGNAGFIDSIGYDFMDASHRPMSGAIVFPNIQDPSSPQAHQVITVTAPAGASYVGLFMLTDGADLVPGLSSGTPVTFTFTDSYQTVIGGTAYPGTILGDPTIDHKGRTYEYDAPGVPGNSNWEDNYGVDQDYDDAMVDAHFYICPPAPVTPSFGAYCGDGVVNQSWEQCDGGSSCTAQCMPTNPTQCTDIVLAKVTLSNVQNLDTTPAPSSPSTPSGGGSTGGAGGGGGNQHVNMNSVFLNAGHSTVAFIQSLFGAGTAYAGAFGNMTSAVFLGSSSYAVPSGTWFPLYVNGAYVSDPSIDGYEDVPGLAVQRSQGAVAVRMYGHDAPYMLEHADGSVEVSGGTITSQTNATGDNALENPTDGVQNLTDAGDEISVSGGKSYFYMTTGTADDGFTTNYSKTSSCTAPSGPTVDLTLTPPSINQGGSSTLSWTSTNATSCTGTGFSTGGATANHVTVSPSITTSYSISCTGPGGTGTDTAILNVTPVSTPPGGPSCTLSADPSSIGQGESSTLSWTISNFASFISTNFSLSGVADFSATLLNGGTWSGFSQQSEFIADLSAGQYFSGLGFRSNCDYYSSEDACVSFKIDSLAPSALAYQPDGGSWSAYQHEYAWELAPGQYFSGIKLRPDCDFYSSDDSCIAVKIATALPGSSAYRSNTGGTWTGYQHDYTTNLSQGQYISGIQYKTNCDDYSSADGCISLKISGGNSISGTSVVSPSVTTIYGIGVTGAGGATNICSTTVTVTPDVCPNIAGSQSTIPDGYQLTNGQCVPIPAPSPTCTLSGPTSINQGDSANLIWSFANYTGYTTGNFSILSNSQIQSLLTLVVSFGGSQALVDAFNDYLGGHVTSPTASGSTNSLTNSQVQSLMSLLATFTGSSGLIDNAEAVLHGTTIAGGGLVTATVSGTNLVTPSVTTTYTVAVSGPGGAKSCTQKVTVIPPPASGCKLQITKSADTSSVDAGGYVWYTINFKNAGDHDCTGGGVEITDTVDPGLSYVHGQRIALVQ